MANLMRHRRLLATAFVAVAVLVTWNQANAAAYCCPFCTNQGQTLTGEVDQATMVLYGTLTKADGQPTKEFPDGKTTLAIESVIKKSAALTNDKELVLPCYLDLGMAGKYKYLVFIDVFKNKIDPYRGVAVKTDSDMPAYLKGALEVKAEKPEKRLEFFFKYLDNADQEINMDAYKEFANADYKDYAGLAKRLPADQIAGWLKDKKTPGYRLGLYASMLGHCGKEEHAALLKSMVDDPVKRVSSGVEGILAGYVLLKPKEGWDYVRGIMSDPDKDFALRHAALKAARFLWEYRSDLKSHKELAEGIAPLLDMKDISDLAIEDFRKWQYWAMADRILGLQQYPVANVNVVKRSMLRYALSAKDNQAAQKYVAVQRGQDPEMVADVEELLKLDQPKK
jgi:hypothetical protein